MEFTWRISPPADAFDKKSQQSSEPFSEQLELPTKQLAQYVCCRKVFYSIARDTSTDSSRHTYNQGRILGPSSRCVVSSQENSSTDAGMNYNSDVTTPTQLAINNSSWSFCYMACVVHTARSEILELQSGTNNKSVRRFWNITESLPLSHVFRQIHQNSTFDSMA